MRAFIAAIAVVMVVSGCQPADTTAPPPGSGQGAVSCKSDEGCSGTAPRCDRPTGRCVACLPTNDNCVFGTRCVQMGEDFLCTSKCFKDSDCPRSAVGAFQACCAG